MKVKPTLLLIILIEWIVYLKDRIIKKLWPVPFKGRTSYFFLLNLSGISIHLDMGSSQLRKAAEPLVKTVRVKIRKFTHCQRRLLQ